MRIRSVVASFTCAAALAGCSTAREWVRPPPLPDRPLSEIRAEIASTDVDPVESLLAPDATLSLSDSLVATGAGEVRAGLSAFRRDRGTGRFSVRTTDVVSCDEGLFQVGDYLGTSFSRGRLQETRLGSYLAAWESTSDGWAITTVTLDPPTTRRGRLGTACTSAGRDAVLRPRWAYSVQPVVVGYGPLARQTEAGLGFQGLHPDSGSFLPAALGASVMTRVRLTSSLGIESRAGVTPGSAGQVRDTSQRAVSVGHRMEYVGVLGVAESGFLRVGIGPLAARSRWSWDHGNRARVTRDGLSLGMTTLVALMVPLGRGRFVDLAFEQWFLGATDAPGFLDLESFPVSMNRVGLSVGVGAFR